MIVRPLALLAVSVVPLLPGCEGAGRQVAERANLRLLAAIPAYPGSARVEVRTEAIRGHELDLPDRVRPVLAYTTNVSVAVPRGTRMRDVLGFYRAALREWRCSTWFDTLPPPSWTAVYMSCRRGRARVGLNTESLLSAWVYELSVVARAPP